MTRLPHPTPGKRMFLACSALLVLVPAACPVRAQEPSASPSAVSAGSGDAIFHQRCIVCHNKQPADDSPFGPPNLYIAFHGKAALTTKAAATIVTNGKGPMPAFGTTLSRSQILSVIAYLRSR